ncbi:hypothetical protein F5Y16DRAFT_373681 [Xylariaceae sp. FL0255]|nr:hypothetical protein F5Y16DRAFT_373681 [Xylariaceae sp. FL0255]
MASPQAAIAKAAFSAVLLRSDPVPCSRSQIDEFFAQLDAAVLRCSSENIQKSKQWILANVAHSNPRAAALAKYTLALASSFSADLATTRKAGQTSTKRKRLHLLYVLSDVLYHTHIRQKDHSFSPNLEPSLLGLFQSAAAFPNSPKHAKKLFALLDLWEENRYYGSEFIEKLRQAVREAPQTLESSSSKNGSTDNSINSSKDTPFIMPTMHGDVTVPWYDLPAANWLPVLEPNSTRPMNPEMIKPLQFSSGPADKQLIKAVENLLADVGRIYSKESYVTDSRTADIDQLGQRVILDETTGAIIGGETYYGWSRSFCEKMKQRRHKKDAPGNGLRGRSTSRSLSRSPSYSHSRSRSRSSSQSSSRPAFKRRRFSESPDKRRGRSRSRSRTGTPEYSRKRSYSRDYNSNRRASFSGSRSRSRSRSPSYSSSKSRGKSRGRSPPYSNNRQYSKSPNPPPRLGPDRNLPPIPPPSSVTAHPPPFNNNYNGHHHQRQQQSHAPNFIHQQHSNLPPRPPDFSQLPVPPPPPPGYQGPWPPPPPHVPASAGIPVFNMEGGGGWGTAPHPPPPPPPPPGIGHSRGGYHQYGRGGRGEYRGQGYLGGWQSRGGRGGW